MVKMAESDSDDRSRYQKRVEGSRGGRGRCHNTSQSRGRGRGRGNETGEQVEELWAVGEVIQGLVSSLLFHPAPAVLRI